MNGDDEDASEDSRAVKLEIFRAICIYEPEGIVRAKGIMPQGYFGSSVMFVPVFIPH